MNIETSCKELNDIKNENNKKDKEKKIFSINKTNSIFAKFVKQERQNSNYTSSKDSLQNPMNNLSTGNLGNNYRIDDKADISQNLLATQVGEPQSVPNIPSQDPPENDSNHRNADLPFKFETVLPRLINSKDSIEKEQKSDFASSTAKLVQNPNEDMNISAEKLHSNLNLINTLDNPKISNQYDRETIDNLKISSLKEVKSIDQLVDGSCKGNLSKKNSSIMMTLEINQKGNTENQPNEGVESPTWLKETGSHVWPITGNTKSANQSPFDEAEPHSVATESNEKKDTRLGRKNSISQPMIAPNRNPISKMLRKSLDGGSNQMGSAPSIVGGIRKSIENARSKRSSRPSIVENIQPFSKIESGLTGLSSNSIEKRAEISKNESVLLADFLDQDNNTIPVPVMVMSKVSPLESNHALYPPESKPSVDLPVSSKPMVEDILLEKIRSVTTGNISKNLATSAQEFGDGTRENGPKSANQPHANQFPSINTRNIQHHDRSIPQSAINQKVNRNRSGTGTAIPIQISRNERPAALNSVGNPNTTDNPGNVRVRSSSNTNTKEIRSAFATTPFTKSRFNAGPQDAFKQQTIKSPTNNSVEKNTSVKKLINAPASDLEYIQPTDSLPNTRNDLQEDDINMEPNRVNIHLVKGFEDDNGLFVLDAGWEKESIFVLN
jgi:hypothetical protein